MYHLLFAVIKLHKNNTRKNNFCTGISMWYSSYINSENTQEHSMKYTDYQLPKTRAWLDEKIAVVIRRTGCTQEQAIAALEAEEWDISDAIVDIVASLTK